MGEVYRARDTTLNRDVAVKVLPSLFATDPERLARFTREAQTLAALNHPNIAHIYGVLDLPAEALSHTSTSTALVMEFAAGEDLSVVIGRGPLPLSDALPIARQIADALETAHEHGIVHRDLKPANVKIAADGTVKVLDFGLAKAMDPVSAPRPDGAALNNAMNSPTFSAHPRLRQGYGEAGTEMGVILGTAAYMAPEQARGKAVDKRADIWAFGVVLFEMLTGRRTFDGDDMSDVLAAVLRQDVPWSRLPADTPPRLRRLLERCLERDVKQRLRDIGEARVEIGKVERGDPDSSTSAVHAAPISPVPGATRPGSLLPWLVAAAATIAAAVVTLRPAPRASSLSIEATIGPPEGRNFNIGSNSGNVTISPDGTTIAFVASATDGSNEPVLWVRPISANEPRPLPGTKGASYPFWSPDSRNIAFFGDRKLFTIEVSGGLPQAVADLDQGRGGCWGDDGRILFTPRGGGTVVSVPASGGTPKPVTRLNAARLENANYWPTCLPGSTHFLYYARSPQAEFNAVYFARTDGTGEPEKVVSSLSSALYVPPAGGGSGYLLWARDTNLLAQPFDAASGRLSGQAVKIATDVLVDESQRGLMAAASTTGTLLWAAARAELLQFAWYDRGGRRLSTVAVEPGHIYVPGLSPDGRSLLFYRAEKGAADVWLHTFADGTTRRLTSEAGYNQSPAWLPDGRGIVYVFDRGVRRISLDGSTAMDTVMDGGGDFDVPVVTPAGQFIVLALAPASGGRSLWAIGTTPPHTRTQLAPDIGASDYSISPDGRWLLWRLTDGTRQNAYLARLGVEAGKPRLGTQRIPVALDGGIPIGWRADGREIYLVRNGHEVVAIPFTAPSDTASLGSPVKLFDIPGGTPSAVTVGVLPTDGTRFLVTEAPFAANQVLHLVTNWTRRLAEDRKP